MLATKPIYRTNVSNSLEGNAESLAQRIVTTLSRIGVSAREVREIVQVIRSLRNEPLAESELPQGKEYIYRELARDGVIRKVKKVNTTYYTKD